MIRKIIFIKQESPPLDYYFLSLHDALPISAEKVNSLPQKIWTPSLVSDSSGSASGVRPLNVCWRKLRPDPARSEEHTSELQSPYDLVCRLLLEKKKIIMIKQELLLLHYELK